jgi:hypothetical protein
MTEFAIKGCLDMHPEAQFKLAGGDIKNIIVNAAFLAAEDSRSITVEQMIKAAKREFQKIGKVCSQSEFGNYYGVICKE